MGKGGSRRFGTALQAETQERSRIKGLGFRVKMNLPSPLNPNPLENSPPKRKRFQEETRNPSEVAQKLTTKPAGLEAYRLTGSWGRFRGGCRWELGI